MGVVIHVIREKKKYVVAFKSTFGHTIMTIHRDSKYRALAEARKYSNLMKTQFVYVSGNWNGKD